MKLFTAIILAFITGISLSLPLPFSFKVAGPALLIAVIAFAAVPFPALMALLIFRPELELFRDSGLLRYFSAVPIGFLFIYMGIKQFDFCWDRLKYLYFFIVVTLLSLIFSVDLKESIVHILRLLSIVAVYLITFNLITTRKEAVKILYCFFLSMIIPVLIGIKQFILGETYVIESMQMERVEGLFVLANSFARFLFITLMASMPLFYYGRIKKSWLWAVAAAAVSVIVLLKVRGVLLAVVISFLILAYYTPRIKRYFWIILPALLILTIALAIGMGMVEHLIHPVQGKVYGGESWFWRLELWKQFIFNAFPRKPFLGFGAGASVEVSRVYTTFENYPHNDYLRMLIENGAAGLVLYLAFFVSYLRYSYRAVKADENRYLNVCVLTMIISFLFMSAAANIFYNVNYFWYFFAFLAVAHKSNLITSRNTGSLK